MAKIKIFAEDGCYPSVMASPGAEDIEIEIIDFNRDTGSKDLLEKRYAETGFKDIVFSIDHCESEDQ